MENQIEYYNNIDNTHICTCKKRRLEKSRPLIITLSLKVAMSGFRPQRATNVIIHGSIYLINANSQLYGVERFHTCQSSTVCIGELTTNAPRFVGEKSSHV